MHEDTWLDSYNRLCTSLIASHSLSNYQKMEKITKLLPLGDCKPSVMLAEILEYCPGESSTTVCAYLSLEVHVLISEDDPADTQAIAKKANRLIALHLPQGHDA